ncbi:MAG: sigma-70 family RNA polymerase sigma factor [Acidobacteriota bacterium]
MTQQPNDRDDPTRKPSAEEARGMAHLLTTLDDRPPTMDAGTVTQFLHAWREGDTESFDRLIPLVYTELRRLAARLMQGDSPNTLQPTALVHEAFLRLIDQQRVDWQDRRHFLLISACIMRRIIIDHARARNSLKRGGDVARVPIDEALDVFEQRCSEYLDLDEALDRFAEIDPLKASVIELRVFGGLTQEETAEALGISRPSVVRYTKVAKAWLRRELG